MNQKCILEIIDYKNIKLHGLSPATRRRCSNTLKYEDPKARYLPMFKLGKWDGKISFFTMGGLSDINHFPIIYEILEEEGYDIDIIDRRPVGEYTFDPIDETYLSDRTWPEGHLKGGEPIILNDHQVFAVNALLNKDFGIIQAATSSGKTIICGALSRQAEKYGRSVIVVPNKDLVEQTYADYINLGLDTGRVYDGMREVTHMHTIATWQSLYSIEKTAKSKPLSDLELEAVKTDAVMVIQDECHLAAAKVMKHIHSNVFKNVPLSYGMTGTLPKAEHLRETIKANFGEVVYTISAKELQDKGILSNCRITINHLQIDKQTFNDYPSEKKFISNHDGIIQLVANDVINMVSQTGNTLILVENVATGQKLQEIIPGSVFLSGKDKTSTRKKEYDEVKLANDKPIIATFGIASTGISIPRLFNLVLFNPGKSFVRVIQSIGRGLRVAHDKDFVNITDYAVNTNYSSRHLRDRKAFYRESSYPFDVVKRKVT